MRRVFERQRKRRAARTLIDVRVAQPTESEEPRFELSVAMLGYLVLLVLLVDSLARHLSAR